MKLFTRSLVIASILFLMGVNIFAQTDEVRQASGLPMLIGENAAAGDKMNVSGRITLETDGKLARRPIIKATVLRGGTPADSAIANDSGVYLIRNVPRDGTSIVIEIDGTEVLRQPILASAMGNTRLDYNIRWPASAATLKPSVISASAYQRSEKNEALFQKMVAAEHANDLKTAMALLTEILTADPKDYTAWTEVGTMYFRSGALDNAEAGYFKAIELKKDYFPALLNLGKLYLQRKQLDNAVLVFTNAVAASPTMPEGQSMLGEAYLQAKKGSMAVKHFNEAIRLDPDAMAEVHLRLAALYDAAGSKDFAAGEYKTFLQKRPNYADKQALEAYIKSNTKPTK